VYNEPADYERLADVLPDVIPPGRHSSQKV
jgi:hypothetical protein